MAIYQLHGRSVVRAAGDDAQKLLNDTLTCRFDGELKDRGRWFALLSPQGKVQVEGLVTEVEGAFWFDLDASLVTDFIKRIKLYRLRAKVDIEQMPGVTVLWTPDDDPPDTFVAAYRDERSPVLGMRYIVRREDVTPSAEPEVELVETYNAAKIAAGIAEFGPDFGVNDVFPHDIGMDLLGGIDFKKGCYIGQEVVSRMQHRGTARRRPAIVDGIPDGAAAGAPVLEGEREAGTIGTPVAGKAVAIVRIDRIEPGVPPTVGGLPVELSLPEWATYRFGEVIAEV